MHLVLVVDRSGSMRGVANEFSTEIDRLVKSQEAGTRVTLVDFDTDIETKFDSSDIDSFGYRLEARGATALHDAIGQTLKAIDPSERRVQIAVFTDGYENSSKQFNGDSIKELISEAKDRGWDFTFIGANQDAVTEGSKFGIAAGDSLTYAANADGIRGMTTSFMARNAVYSTTGVAPSYTEADRQAALASN